MTSNYRSSSNAPPHDHTRLECPSFGCMRSGSDFPSTMRKSVLFFFIVNMIGSEVYVVSKRTPTSASNPSLSADAVKESPSILRSSKESSSAMTGSSASNGGLDIRLGPSSISMDNRELYGDAYKKKILAPDLEVKNWEIE